jgi:hypothetical protein
VARQLGERGALTGARVPVRPAWRGALGPHRTRAEWLSRCAYRSPAPVESPRPSWELLVPVKNIKRGAQLNHLLIIQQQAILDVAGMTE